MKPVLTILTTLVLSLLTSQNAFSAETDSSTETLAITFAVRIGSPWTAVQMNALVIELQDVFRPCGINKVEATLASLGSDVLPVVVEKFNALAPNSYESIAARTAGLSRPTVFLIDSLNAGANTPFSRDQFIDLRKPVPAELRGTIWLPYWVNSNEYKNERKNSPYSVLAHEMAHILSLDGAHNNDATPNLFTIHTRRNNSLTETQCRLIQLSPYLKTVL